MFAMNDRQDISFNIWNLCKDDINLVILNKYD